MKSLHTLLAGAIDYAGLFPPAKLDMENAVHHYAAYRGGQYAWALGRFIVPAAQLHEFEQAFMQVSEEGGDEWGVSLLVGSDVTEHLEAIAEFNQRSGHGQVATARIDAVEIKASAAEEMTGFTAPRPLQVYVEVPLDPDPGPVLDAIAAAGVRAKVRTGGVTPGAFPDDRHLARFVIACAERKLAFKATAGLHHALRAQYRLTYEPDSPSGMMYGFLNMLVAAAVARDGGDGGDVVAALNDPSALNIRFDDTGFTWSRYHNDLATIAALRKTFFTAFGSCSFTEPIEDLKSLELL